MKIFVFLFAAAAVLVFLVGPTLAASPSDIPRMTKEQLKPLLGNPDVSILDVRSAPDYNSSPEKIKGAIRVEPGNVSAITDKYPKDRTIVLY